MESKRIGIFRNAADAVQVMKILASRIRKMLPRLDPDRSVPAGR